MLLLLSLLMLLMLLILLLLRLQKLGSVSLKAEEENEVRSRCDPLASQVAWARWQGELLTRPRCYRRASAAGGLWRCGRRLWEQILSGSGGVHWGSEVKLRCNPVREVQDNLWEKSHDKASTCIRVCGHRTGMCSCACAHHDGTFACVHTCQPQGA